MFGTFVVYWLMGGGGPCGLTTAWKQGGYWLKFCEWRVGVG